MACASPADAENPNARPRTNREARLKTTPENPVNVCFKREASEVGMQDILNEKATNEYTCCQIHSMGKPYETNLQSCLPL